MPAPNAQSMPSAPAATATASVAPSAHASAMPEGAVGYVVGEVRTDAFAFVSHVDAVPPRLEYVVLRGVAERVGDQVRTVDVLAQVTRLSVSNRLLAPSLSFAEVEAILRRLGASPPIVMGEATVLGYLDAGSNSVRLPRGAALPGMAVERAPDALLTAFFNRGRGEGIAIGHLINRPAVPVNLDPNGLNRHLAVIAQTGAGKSYTVGVVLEQLLELGASIIVLDPNSDYVLLRRTPERAPTPFAERVTVYRLPLDQQHRITDEEIGGVTPLTVQFSKLTMEEICEMAGIGEGWANVRKGLQSGLDRLRGDYTPEQLVRALEDVVASAGPGAGADEPRPRESWLPGDDGAPSAGLDDLGALDDLSFDALFGDPGAREPRRAAPPERGRAASADAAFGAGKAIKYIEALARLPFWGHRDVPIDDLVRPMRLSAIDLAGVDRRVMDFIAAKILHEVWLRATRGGLGRPVFIVLEEAHNLVPSGQSDGRAGWIIRRIAAEGRKFGVFLVLITQRPGRVHADTLSQCGSQIIMRLTNPDDQNAVRRAAESVSEALLGDLPGLNIGEAVALGPLVRVPVMVRVSGRRSKEGGSDFDIARALEAARAQAVTERYIAADAAERAARPRTERREEL